MKLKKIQIIIYTKQKLTYRHRKETGDYQRVEGVGKEQIRIMR